MNVKTKKCNGCLKEKELYYFTRVYRSHDGLCHMCKECVRARKSPTMNQIIKEHSTESPVVFSSYRIKKKVTL